MITLLSFFFTLLLPFSTPIVPSYYTRVVNPLPNSDYTAFSHLFSYKDNPAPAEAWDDTCIRMAMTLTLKVPKSPCTSDTMDITIDPSKKNITVDGKCTDKANNQSIGLTWSEVSKADNKTVLKRTIGFDFFMNSTDYTYGISYIRGMFAEMYQGKVVIGRFQGNFSSNPLFQTSNTTSYSCSSADPVKLDLEW